MNAPTPAAPAASVLIVSGLKREAAILAGPGRLAVCGDGQTLGPDWPSSLTYELV